MHTRDTSPEIVEIRFDALSYLDRDRIAQAARGARPPAPLLAEHVPTGTLLLGRGFIAALPTVLLALLAVWGFGRPASSLGVQGLPFVVLYAAVAVAIVLVVVAAVQILAAPRALPFPPGKYLFPREFVDARGPVLRVVSLGLLNGAEIEGQGSGTVVCVYFAGGVVERIASPSRDQAERVVNYLLSRREGANAQWIAEPPGADEDLFASARALGRRLAVAEYERIQQRSGFLPALPLAMLAAIALAGAVLGAGLFFGRNLLSDERMFAVAREQNRSTVYRQYAENGVRHRDEAIALGDEAERREIVEAAYEAFQTALAARDAEELRKVLARNPDVPFAGDIREAIRSVYRDALDDYRRRAPADPNAVAFVEKLLDYMADIEPLASPVVLVSFKIPSETARDFVANHSLGEFEEQLVERLKGDFGGVFRPDLVRVESGLRYSGDADEVGSKFPILEVAYDLRKVTSGVYISQESGEQSFALHFTFDVTMRLPNGGASAKQHLDVPPPQHLSHSRYQTVYEAAAENAFRELGDRLDRFFFKV